MDGGLQTLGNTSAEEPNKVVLVLDRLKRYKKAPKGVAESYAETQRAEKNAAENQLHFNGKAECSRFIASLEADSTESRKQLAAEVAAAIPETLEKKINNLHKRKIMVSQNPDKRRREYFYSDLHCLF